MLIALEKVRDILDKNNSTLKVLLEPTDEWSKYRKKKRCTKCLEEIDLPFEKFHTIYDEPKKNISIIGN
jgi:hypothetical protein